MPGTLAECFAKGPFAVRENSRLFYAECTAFPSAVLVKLCLRPHTREADPGSAQRQYEALLRVSRAMGEGKQLSVPRPYLVQAEMGLLATEWVSGASMTELVFSWRCNRDKAQQLMARAGRWLKCFHACHVLAPGRLDVEEKLAFIAEMETTHAISDEVFFQALALLRQSAEATAALTLQRSWLHGDFKTDNLIVSGPRTVGIDIHLRHEAPVIYDLALFLNHLELRLCYPSAWRLAASQALLREAFLASYLEHGDAAIAIPLAWAQLYMILGEWHDCAQAASWLRTTFARLCYRKVAARLASRIALGRRITRRSGVA